MEPLLCYPDPVPVELARVLHRAGYQFQGATSGDALRGGGPASREGPWGGAVVCADQDLPAAIAFCRTLRRREIPVAPLLLVLRGDQISDLRLRDDLFDDFCTSPVSPDEVTARLEHLLWRAGMGLRPDLIEYGPLVLNLETYQAAVSGRVLDLTYMEYELLRFLAAHPGKVFTRETLLSRVWGYEYYGGARTVDVHVRRLRAKLGEEHAHLIQTVRSVGYRFGQVGWAAGPIGRPTDD
jgi:DNA-binding response OmpR family regulator